MNDPTTEKAVPDPAPVDGEGEAQGSSEADGRSLATRYALAPLVALVLVKAGYYALIGPALILDDWRLLNKTEVNGYFHTLDGGYDAVSSVGRPVAWLWFNLVYAVAGDSAMRLLVIVTVLNLAIVVLLYLVLSRLVSRSAAFWVTAVWILLPTHTALSVWGAVAQALLSLVLFLAGVLALTKRRWLVAAIVFAAATLCYQVAIPLTVLAAVAVPAEGGLSWRDRAKVVVAVALASLWVAAHPTYPTSFQIPDVPSLWRAHFGTGLLASSDPPAALRTGLAVFFLAAVVVTLVAWVRGRRGWDEGPSLVLLGLVVWAGGLVVLVSTPLWVQAGEFGLTDRVFGLSSMGSALVIVGVGQYFWRRFPRVVVVGAVGLVGVLLAGQYVALHAWSQAGDDAVAMLDHLSEVSDTPNETVFMVGPNYPVRNNVISLEADAVYYANKHVNGPGAGNVTFYVDPFTALVPGQVLVPWSTVADDLPDQFYEPIDGIDVTAQTPEGLQVSGWAIDRSTSEPIGVEVFVDGGAEPYGTIERADLTREDLVAPFGLGADHGFDQVLPGEPLAPGTHEVCIRGISVHPRTSDDRPLMQCIALEVPPT